MEEMKVLLTAVNAKYIHSNLAVYSLQAYAKKYREQIEIAEYTINHQKEHILMDLYRRKPDIIAVSCYIWNIDMVKDILKELRKILPNVKIWLGGPEVSYETERFLREEPYIDGIMIGEGEETFLRLMDYYQKGSIELEDIKCIQYHVSARKEISGGENHESCNDGKEISGGGNHENCNDGKKISDGENNIRCYVGQNIKENNARCDKREQMSGNYDMDKIYGTYQIGSVDFTSLPFPYEDMTKFENKIIYYETSRGCPYSCSYCLSSIEKGVRFRDMNLVKQELKLFLDNNIPQVKFIDRTFNCNHKRAIEIWQFLKDNDNGITNFHFEISADLINEEEIALLQTLREGLIQFEIGVQSTNPKTIEAIHRTMNLEKLEKVVNQVRAARNIHQHLDLIAGLPYEDITSFRQSFADVYRMKPDQLQLGFLKVLKGSKMYEEQKKHGIIYQDKTPYEVLYTDWLSYGDVLTLKKVEDMVEVYYNSTQFVNSITFLEHFYENPYDFYLALGNYYEEKGLLYVSHTRMARYEILLDFVGEHFPDIEEVFREILIYDLYLRENLKSRPFYAKDQNRYKDVYRKFYQNMEMVEKCLPEYKEYQSKQIARMTHLEHFDYDIEETVRTGGAVPKEQFVIFDYKKRDFLHYSARTVIITQEEMEQIISVKV